MFLGPVFAREVVTTPRRPRHYLVRAVYVTALLVLMCTAWLVVAGTQIIRNTGDMARFGSILFQILAPLQLALMVFLSALTAASAVSQEKDRRTLILLLMTRMSNGELVLGKLFASLLNVLAMLAAAFPVFVLITLFGGVSLQQVIRVFGVTFTATLAAGSLGSLFAFWREKTFQTLAMTALALMLWIGIWEGLGVFRPDLELVVASLSPIRAILAATQPALGQPLGLDGAVLFMLAASGAVILLNGISIAMVRVWNPSREVRRGQSESESMQTIFRAGHEATVAESETARAEHVDARVRTSFAKSRRVWDNPILWREACTWAYGRKVLVIRAAYVLLFCIVAAGVHWSIAEVTAGRASRAIIPPPAVPLAPFFFISLVIVNALAVTSITNERDGQALDLLLVTDLTPKEFVFGKLGGVFWVTKEMVVLPMLLCIYLWWQGGMSTENLVFVLIGMSVMYSFANMLGIHCGMHYANSRSAIGVSLGVVFFLFLGVVTCMLIMISFSGSFQTQLTPFLAFILGGGIGLFVVLGHRNPSQAIMVASLCLPFATFYSITSFLLQHSLPVVLVTGVTYGFTTAAMLVPAIYSFDIAMGRTKGAGEE